MCRDLEYLRDLGLLAVADSPPRIANPIYREVVPRELGYVLQDSLDIHTRWYVDGDGRLNMTKLLTAFARSSGSTRSTGSAQLGAYREAAPQLILQSYLHRVVNSGGRIEREYGLGRGGRTCWCCGRGRRGSPRTCGSGSWWSARCCGTRTARASRGRWSAWVKQTLGYMAQCGAEEGHLVVMDRRTGAKERRRSEAAEDRREGEGGGGAAGSVEPRHDERRVVVWML